MVYNIENAELIFFQSWWKLILIIASLIAQESESVLSWLYWLMQHRKLKISNDNW